MAEGTSRVLRRLPSCSPGDVKDAAAFRILPAPADDRLGDRGIDQRLCRGLEPGADERPGGPQCQGGGHATTVGDPTGRQHRRRCRQVHHDRYERQRGPPAPRPVPTALAPLRHDDIGPQIHRRPGLLQIGDLNDHRSTGCADSLDERARISEGEHHSPRAVLQCLLDRADTGRPAEEPNTPRSTATSNDR